MVKFVLSKERPASSTWVDPIIVGLLKCNFGSLEGEATMGFFN